MGQLKTRLGNRVLTRSLKQIIMKFKKFNEQIQKQFAIMCKTEMLFRANVSGSEIWDLYLSSFEDEKIFRDPESSEHNCNCCKNFIRRYGNVVSVNENGLIETLFTNIGDVGEYSNSANAVDLYIKSKDIKDVFFETYNELNEKLNYESCKKNQTTYQLGIKSNLKKYTQEEVDKFGVVNTEKVYEFCHFSIDLPNKFVDSTGNSIEQIMAHYRDKYNVFKRAIVEIPLDTLHLVRDLINQGSLLDGTSHLHAIEEMIPIKQAYDSIVINDVFYWVNTYLMEERTSKFKNTLIGVLCTELAEGEELNKACQNWNKRVDPVNYHKATAPITKKQIEEAQKFVEENGYTESFDRRLATIDDIKASEIKHINIGDGKIKEVSIFDNVKATSTQHKRSKFDNVDEIGVDKFISDILPNCTLIEAYLKNSHEGNMVALTTTNQEESKPLFKWSNNYSWTFNGNLAGKSQIKEAVKVAGGKVDGVLRFSIYWNDDGRSICDFDAHCITPATEIYYSNKQDRITGGWLDVDMIRPSKIGVENITWQDLSKMSDGKYVFYNKNFDGGRNTGFKAEIEFDGEMYSYESPAVNGYQNIMVATVILNNGQFTIEHHLPSINSSKELWNLETNSFHKVNLVCLSPNHWDKNQIGNKHYMFMLDGCKTNTSIRGFHNENLSTELLKHRKVMEVLGATNMIQPNGKHLAGIGFNSTVRDELIVKCSGSFKRMLKIKF